MTCPSCRKAVTPGIQKCPHYGSRLSSRPTPREPGRGGLLIGLGVTSIVFLGPFLGIPAWVMGRRDLQKIRRGSMRGEAKTTTKVGMVLGIIGTFVSTISLIIYGTILAIVLSLFSANAIQTNKDAMLKDVSSIARYSVQYHLTNRGSFAGIRLPAKLSQTENGRYAVRAVSPNELWVAAISAMNTENTIQVIIRGDGSMNDWIFGGDFM